MLTLHELKQITDIPSLGNKVPTARYLRENEEILVKKKINTDAEVMVFQCGYAVYHVSRYYTVYPLDICGEYQYFDEEGICVISEEYFDQRPWYVRVALEGEDRLNHNQEVREQGKTVSYSAVSEEWEVMAVSEDHLVEEMHLRAIIEALMEILTEQQRNVVCGYYFGQKSQRELSKEMEISASAVSRILARAIQRVRRNYPKLEERYGGNIYVW